MMPFTIPQPSLDVKSFNQILIYMSLRTQAFCIGQNCSFEVAAKIFTYFTI